MSASSGAEGQAGNAGGAGLPWQPAAGQLPIEQVLQAEAVVIATVPGSEHNEGVAYRQGDIFWCDLGGLFRLEREVSLFLHVPNDSCGAALAIADGSLLLALGEHGLARLNGTQIEQLATLPMGGFANDLSLDPWGNIYVSNLARGDVLRVTPAGDVSMTADLPGANGLEVDPAGRYLYLNQSSQDRVVRLPLGSAGLRSETEVVTGELQSPDGAAFDAWGNYWVAEFGTDRIRILSPEGALLGTLDSGGPSTTNLTFGGPARDVLYVTGGGTLRKILVGVPGFAGHPAARAYAIQGELPLVVTDAPQ